MSANERQDWTGQAIELAEEADFSLGKLRVRPSSREALVDGQVETLEPRVMQVLVALARRRGEVVSRDQLIDLCWSGRAVSEDALNRSMTKLRRLSSASTFTLETIPRIGYRLTAGPPPEAAQPAQPAAPPQSEPTREGWESNFCSAGAHPSEVAAVLAKNATGDRGHDCCGHCFRHVARRPDLLNHESAVLRRPAVRCARL